MFVRTKDKIIKVDETGYIKEIDVCGKKSLFVFSDKYLYGREVVKQADTIEELCDEFVYIKDGVVNQYLTIDFKHKREDEYCSLRNKLTANGIAEISKGISKYELENGELKFAIWTDTGLKYIAKMNDKGELELI